MFWLKCVLVLILGILGTNSGSDPFSQQPRIAIQDGHLTIRSAFNRNVSLSVSGQGSVHINNVDMGKLGQSSGSIQTSTVASLNQRMSQLLNQWRSISDLAAKVNQLEENVTEIVQRMNQFVGSDQNRINNRGIRRYFAKVNTLEEKVNHLTQLLSTDECSSNPCRNGGTCVDAYNSYVCKCPLNWEGPYCDNDVNECALYAGTAFGCQNGATCINLQGSYRCDCPTNWFGIHCSEQHDDCSTASHQELCGHGTCVDEKRVQPGQPKYRCLCEPGWTKASGTPACTQDVNECQGDIPKCSVSPQVLCFNLPGTFHCGPCPVGYTGNGLWCEDLNECENQNGGCSINPFVECYNTPGSRRCGPCPTGYFGNGEQCMYQSVCNNNRGGCHPLATCIDNPAITATYRECRCPAGYVGNGEGLTGCVQNQGMTCANNPCQHGTCQVVGQSYHCVCQAGYYGTHCEIAEDPCFRTPCQNGGTCNRGGGTFTCTCPEGYSGPTCAEERRVCGGYLSGANGTLHYPEDGSHYAHQENCGWVITVEPGKVLNVTFDHFHLEEGYNCEFDFLQLNDGPNAGSRTIGRFCSDQLHGATFSSTHNQVYLWFQSDQSISATGFTITWKAVDPVCGGELNVSEYGSVRSPGYPGMYPINRTCSWLVQVPYGKRIQFSFATLMLEHHENCSFDYLKIIDGASDRDPVLETYCTTEAPPPLITSGHTATLLFHSDWSVQDHGFNIAYSAIPAIQGCGGTVTTPQGSITSPNFPNVYHDNMLCEWLVRIHPNNRLKISFTDFNLESHRDCSFDSVEIYDGSSDADPLLGRFCGTNIPLDILSNSHQVYIRFKTDMSQRYPGFKLEYRTICGGVYTELTGLLTSPYYPDPYPSNSICLYEIRLPHGYLVNFTIHNIEIEQHPDCVFDYLEVRDGGSESSPRVALLCGNSAPDSIVSTYNLLWLKFETDGSVQNLGFNAQYEAMEIGCGGIMVNSTGQISSPRHPDSYPNSIDCTWLIRAPEGSVVQLTFSTFVLEQDGNCAFDYVLIEDTNGALIGRYCGTVMPPVLTSMDSSIIVKFVADGSVALDGFIADYRFLDASEFCGGDFYQESGILRSPGYPNHYPHSAHCVWVLHAGNSRQITLNVTDFNTEHHTECKFDYLEIRNGGYETSPSIGKFCGDQILRTITSHSNLLRLEFKTDSSMSAPGFEIHFDSSSVGCGGILTTPRGSIVSPNYPQSYPLNADCEWLIRVSEGSLITLTIVEIDIEEHETCLYDYLQVFDGDSENSKSLIRICNNQQNPGSIRSTGNTMLLRFRTDFSEEAGGFHLIYQTLCNNVLTKRRGVIESPNFPNSYPHNHNCSWLIQSSPGSDISISFSHIFIEANDNCTLDYVEVLENLPNGTAQLGKFCGDMSTPPSTIKTRTNNAVVRLITDRSVSKEGFRLEWTVNGCGGDIINKPSGTIMSPNYPSGYPFNTVCYWRISYPPGSKIQFTVEDLDLEPHDECYFDFLRAYGGEDEQSPRLLNLCHSLNNQTVVTSHGNELYVHFQSDVSVSHRGFKATFKKLEGEISGNDALSRGVMRVQDHQVVTLVGNNRDNENKTTTGNMLTGTLQGCGGIFTAADSIIVSPGYPENYNANDDCEWQIEVSTTNLVMLEFYDFKMPEAINCSQGYLAIYDGASTSSPLLMKHCGAKPEGFIRSTGNQMLVKLMADGNSIDRGFKAHYKQGCGRRLLVDNGGEIQSPYYPDPSLEAVNCSWILYTSQIGEKVSLTTTHLFIYDHDNCTYNSMLVFDGDMQDSPMIGQYCGHRIPPPIVSRGSILHVLLKNHGVFRATYGLLSEHCGGSFTSAAGSFASPGYPTNYDMEMECVWTIEASAGNKIHVTFESFHLESGDFCNTDYVEIHEDGPSGRLIGKYCGSSIPSNVTAFHKIWIKFRSDDIGTAPGFLAHYELQHGTTITGTSGNIASPGYPQKYQRSDDYEWTVIVPDHMFVSVEFYEIGITLVTQSSECHAYIQIFDGMNNEAASLGRFCGHQVPEPIVSISNAVTIALKSADYYQSVFYLHWSAVNESGVRISPEGNSSCFTDYTLNLTEATVIASPDWPAAYPANMNCTYIIRTVPTHHVQLQFTRFQMEGTPPPCAYDRLISYYAPNTNIDSWILNSTYCGARETPQISSPNNLLKLSMVSDMSVQHGGFQATATAECGGQLFGSSGVLHSSSIFDHLQSSGSTQTLQCEWVITVRQRRTIQISFENFAIASDSTCSTSYILIRNGEFSTSPLLGAGRYCTAVPPTTLETSSNIVYVMMVYNPVSGSAPTFNLRYTEMSMGCGGHIYLNDDTPSSEFSSPGYPSPPAHDIECEWIIVAPSGTRLRVDFDAEFKLGHNCFEGDDLSYLQLHDGGSEDADILKRYCGNDQPSSEMTTGNALFVSFLTTGAELQAGFRATVRIANCGGTINAINSIIESPGYPSNYPSSVECEWYLKMKYGYHIILTIREFETPNSSNCSLTDYLEIRDMSPDGDVGQVLRTFCGNLGSNLSLVIDVGSPFAYIKFKSNPSVVAKGFSMTMEAKLNEGCGGRMDLPFGTITSPLYPNAIHGRRECYWRIIAPAGRKVKVEFDAINLPKDVNNTCSSFIAMFNVTNFRRAWSDDSFHRHCGETIPDTIESSASVLYVHFKTDGLTQGQGFSFRYSTREESMCGGLLSAPSGALATPNFTIDADSVIDCSWRIDIEANKTLSIKFDILDIPGNKGNYCRDGVIYVFTDRYLGSLCGNYTNGYLLTLSYAETTLRLIASLKKPFGGFRGTYNTSNCGGVIDGSNAVITSPGYPNNYPQNMDCQWILTVPEGEIIRINVEDMRLEEDCTKDYVKVRNGLYLEYPVIGHFCGSHTPVPITSSGRFLVVNFHSDQFGSSPGFKMTTAEVQRGCGGLIHMLSGNFSSPNYPSRYDNNVECVWTIEYRPGYLVKVEFLGRFDIEMDTSCSKDYLQIEDAQSNGLWTPREKKCGSSTPDVLISKSNKLKVTFHTDARIAADGFNLKYTAVCGGNFSGPAGDIISPNYPENYNNDLSCTYSIGKSGDYIVLAFDELFSMEGHENCIFDYIEIFQSTRPSPQSSAQQVSQGTFCGTTAPAPRTLMGPVLIKFQTDSSYMANGFKLHYEIMECGAVLTEPTGVISAPRLPSDFLESIDCTWSIIAPEDKVISLRFLRFNMSATYGCWNRFLDIRDGNATGPQIGRICSNPPVVKSHGNQLTIRYYSRSVLNDFSIYYQTTYGPAQGCGGFKNMTSGEIRSLDIDSDGRYEPNLDCGWTILANVVDQVIKLTFDTFNLEPEVDGNCTTDYVELRENGANGPQMGIYCGSTIPGPIISSVNQVFVHFHSGDVVSKSGFKITFTVLPSPCGQSALMSLDTEQTLTSPNYPNLYPVNLRCRWTIRVNASDRFNHRALAIELALNNLDIPCGADYLQIKSHSSHSSVMRVCGSSPSRPVTIRSGGELIFHSGSVNNNAHGFSITYKDRSCSRNYTDDEGVILDLYYYSRQNTETACRINITVSEGKTISLYFRRFHIPNSQDCYRSYLKVYDGDNNVTAPLLGNLCGFTLPTPFFSTGRSLLIEVNKRDNSVLYQMAYTSTDQGRGCGGTVFAIDGVISSPLYPQPYNKTGECIWRLAVPGYHTMRLYFRDFSLNSTTGCDVNYVEIYEGATEDISTRIGRYCGDSDIAVHDIRSNEAVVKFVTDSSNTQRGFLMYFDSSTFIPDTSVNLMQRDLPQET